MNPATLQPQLQLPYRRESWKVLLPQILPGRAEIFQQPSQFPLTNENQRAVATDLRQIGRFVIPDAKGGQKILAVFEVDVAPRVHLPRNRVALRQLVARCIDEVSAHAVLAFFAQPGRQPYRLTYAARESALDPDTLAVEIRETATRRFTYVLGPGESRRTAASRLAALAQKHEGATLKDVTDAFSVDLLNKEFFDTYKAHYQKFCAHLLDGDAPARVFGIKLQGLGEKARDHALKPVRDFVKKMMGRLVFLHFLQKKGWLGCPPNATAWKDGDPEFLLKLLRDCPAREQGRFHSRRLVPLFFETLNGERSGDIFPITGTRVPYLNGGLFEKDFDGVEKIDFPTELFAALLEFFGQYNFTIDENDPDENEIGIDPEMLGHIFENLLEENKDKGAYYTPKPVVQYMCQQSLIHALAGHFPGDSVASAEIERFVRFKEPIDPKQDSWLARHATTVEKVLDDLCICDPAIGSGAFPIGLLQEIFWTKLTLHPALNRAKTKRGIIQRSIHGVDMDAGAVEIARLRFWLALIVDEPEPLPLPNLDYQIMQGNSLLESFERLDLSRISEPTRVGITLLGSDQGEMGFSAKQIEIVDASGPREDLAALQQKYFLLHDPEAKAQLRHRIDHAVLRAIDDQLEHRKEHLDAALDNWERELARKRLLKRDYEPTKAELKKREAMQTELDALADKKTKLHALVENPRAERPFFLWHLWFRHILNTPPKGRGGFDIVIGNPPYVRADNAGIGDQRQAILADGTFVTLWEKWDLYVAFIELGHRLLRTGGVEAMIVSDAYCHSKYAIKSQDWFLKNAIVRRLDFLGKLQIFDAGVKNMIFFYERGDGSTNIPERRLHTHRLGNVQPLPSERQAGATHRLFFPGSAADTFDGFPIKTVLLGDLCYISVGMVVHADEKVAKGAFELQDLVSDIRDRKHPRPFVEGKHLQRWHALTHKWLEWGTGRAPTLFRRPTFPELYPAPKILIHRTGGEGVRACLDQEGTLCNHTVLVAVPWHTLAGVENKSLRRTALYPKERKRRESDKPDRIVLESRSKHFDLHFTLGVMNSKVARQFLRRDRRSNTDLYPEDWKLLPIPDVALERQAPIVSVASLLISILSFFSRHPQARTARDELLISFLEALSDALVAQLYYPEQFRAKGLDAAKLVGQERLPNPDNILDPEAMDAVRAALEKAYDINQPLRAVLYDFGSMELAAEAEAAK
jgi:hypothetical protein